MDKEEIVARLDAMSVETDNATVLDAYRMMLQRRANESKQFAEVAEHLHMLARLINTARAFASEHDL